ncbi:ribosome 60S biogenesis N-terminal-domain-containing protein [Amylocystis lapponica]|nr:ribosome 60S biogenesis N-terminal-domain-containing protein [Amylocystis lapponica]
MSSSKVAYKFSSAADIKRVLNVQDEAKLVQGLTALRNQLTVKYGESTLAPHDDRINLARSWLQAAPGAQNIFEIWEAANSRQMSLLSLVIAVLSSLLNLLSFHYTDHGLAQPIFKTLLSPQWMHRLNSYLGGSHTELILVTLKLFNSMSDLASGRERKAVLEAFAWEAKALPKLLYMRRKGKTDDSMDILDRPDIRTLYVLFILSFVDKSTSSSVKSAFLEQRRDVFTSIFKGLFQDSYSLVRKVLEVCWTGIWSDSKLRRTTKINLFNEPTLVQLVKLYVRGTAEGGEPDHIPADVVHHFLLAMCTRPGIGLCFRDRGWYPREADGEGELVETHAEAFDDRLKQRGSRVYNKILANVLKTLKVNDEPRQQELAFKILMACPELVAGYWSSAGLALEPRLSSKWIANISFLGAVVSLPVPQSSFLLHDDAQALYNPVPPPLANVLENIVPSANIKTHLSRGLQSPSALVQHCSAIALAKCLMKYDAVRHSFEKVERALEEEEEGQWAKRRREVEREVRKRIPEFQVVVGFSQKLNDGTKSLGTEAATPTEETGGSGTTNNPAKAALLAESAQRLLWLYHRCLPTLVAEARFDVGKLLLGFQDVVACTDPEVTVTTAGLDVLRQLHVLRLLRESDQFSWSGKAGSSHSNLYTLLKVFVATEVSAIRIAIASLLSDVLSASIIFQHDSDEISLWLDSLPTTKPAADEKATVSNSAPLTDETHGVIMFLDDCVQRCIKTPYRYIEELQLLVSSSTGSGHATHMADFYDEMPSPLIMAVLEQLGAKLKGHLLLPSDALAITSFVRKLTFRLASKLPTLGFLDTIATKVTATIQEEHLFPEHPSMTAAIQREAEFLGSNLRRLRCPSFGPYIGQTVSPGNLLSRAENIDSEDDNAKKALAFEVVNWLRLVDHPADCGHIVTVVRQLYRPALKDFFEHLDPERLSLWNCVRNPEKGVDYLDQLSFELLWVHSSDEILAIWTCRQALVDCLFKRSVDSTKIKRALRLTGHMLTFCASDNRDGLIRNVLQVQGLILKKAKELLSCHDYLDVARYYFQFDAVRDICFRHVDDEIRQGLAELLEAAIDIFRDDDRQLISDITSFWAASIAENVEHLDEHQTETALLWTRYSGINETVALLDSVMLSATINRRSDTRLIEELLNIVAPILSSNSISVTLSVPRLLQAKRILPSSPMLESLLASALRRSLPLCHDGLTVVHSAGGDNALADIIPHSQRRWSQRLHSIGQVDLTPTLETHDWSDSTAEIVTNVLYQQHSARSTVVEWLRRRSSATWSITHLTRVLFALFDAGYPATEDPEFILPYFSRLVRAIIKGKSIRSADVDGTHSLCSKCVSLILDTLPTLQTQLLQLVKQECQLLAPGDMSLGILAIGRRLTPSLSAEVHELLNLLVDIGLGWAVRHFSGDKGDDGCEVLVELAALLTPSMLKTHLAEPVLVAVIQNSLFDENALHFVQILVSTAQFKPATVNKYLQSIVQHPHLYELCALSITTEPSSRDAIVSLLHTLFYLHPINTCQPTHIEPLRRLYGGSLSLSDRRLLSIFHLFESTRKMSAGALFTKWASSADAASSSSLEAVQTLDPTRVLKTCLAFPNRRHLHEHVEDVDFDTSLYDPVFVTLLFAQMLWDDPPSSALGWVQLFRTNAVSLIIRALSAEDESLREVAFAQVAALYRCLQDADVQERPHVLHILNLLKDVFPSYPDTVPRIPAYSTLLLAHALRALFYPANFIYPLTARFLLQRPTLDPEDVPLLFGMLYSTGDAWKKERMWIVRFLADGMVAGAEWRVLRRRHTWDLLASLFQIEQRDVGLRRGILEVLANITCNVRATTSLVLKNFLLAWIELQLTRVRSDEGVAWIKILENVVAVPNAAKMEAATNGEWRFALSRCLFSLVASSSCSENMFLLAVPVVLRLCLLPGDPIPHLGCFFRHSLSWLASIEKNIHIPQLGRLPQKFDLHHSAQKRLPPHSASRLYEVPDADSIQVWGKCVETLWHISMTTNEMCPEWDELTARLLVWRSIAGAERCLVGEWARKEVLRNLSRV